MSRFYGMSVKIEKVAARSVEKVKAASAGEWPFENWDCTRTSRTLSSYAEGQLAGGETEEEFTDRAANRL